MIAEIFQATTSMNENEVNSKRYTRKKFSLSMAFWHWSNLLIITGILLTVLLVKTIFGWKENSPLIQRALEGKGITISLDEAKAVAKIYSHKLWDWHVYFGYVLSGLFVFRLILDFFEPIDRRSFSFLKLFRKPQSNYVILVRGIYFIFYLDLAVMVITGLFIKFSENYPDLKPIKEIIKDIHGFGMYVILAFIIVHLIGLALSEFAKKSNKVG